MKNASLLSIVMLLFITLGCSSDDDGGGNGGAAAGTISSTVSGTSDFNSTSQATTAMTIMAGPSETITVTGSDASGRNITMIINGFTGVGTYPVSVGTTIAATFSYTEVDTATFTSVSWAAPYSGMPADSEINFSEVTATNVKGTFMIMAKEQNGTSEIDFDGSFNVDL